MKCCGVRETPSGFKPCGRLARTTKYEAFCSEDHQREAKQFVGDDAYKHHLERFNKILEIGTPSLMKTFNDTARPMFVSMIAAQKQKFQQVVLQDIVSEYSAGVQSAWAGVASTSDVDVQQIQHGLKYAQKALLAVKRERENVADLSRKLCLTDSETSSRDSKRSKASDVSHGTVGSDDVDTTLQSQARELARMTMEKSKTDRLRAIMNQMEELNAEEYIVDEPEDMQE